MKILLLSEIKACAGGAVQARDTVELNTMHSIAPGGCILPPMEPINEDNLLRTAPAPYGIRHCHVVVSPPPYIKPYTWHMHKDLALI